MSSEPPDDDFESGMQLPPSPTLRLVLPLARDLGLFNGMRTIVTSIELWSNEITLHFRQIPPPFSGTRHLETWTFKDDVGTDYSPGYGSGAGGSWSWRGAVTVQPAPPSNAHRLFIRCDWSDKPNDDQAVAPFEVELPNSQ